MSSNDWNNPPSSQATDSKGTDGWVEPPKRRERKQRDPRPFDFAEPDGVEARAPEIDLGDQPHYPLARTEHRRRPAGTRAESAESGQAMAIFAHLSILFGLPVFLLPMIQRNNAFALHHAKAAGAIYGIFLMCGLVSFMTCGLAVPLAMLCYVPAIVGIVKAAQGEEAGAWGLGDLGEQLFSGLETKPKND